MTEQNTTPRTLAGVLEELSASRGYTLAGMAEVARRMGHAFTPEEIVNAAGGFGVPISAVLGLSDEECRRVTEAMSADWQERINVKRSGGEAIHPEPIRMEPQAPGCRRYPSSIPPEERRGARVCSVSHPAAGGPCEREATMVVWELNFCDFHGEEAEAAALAEMWENAREEISSSVRAARPRWRRNGALLSALRASEDDARGREESSQNDHEPLMERVYGDADASHTDRETLAYNGDAFAGTPAEWWSETRRALCRSMREAHEGGLPALLHALEPLREWATVQGVLAVRRELSRTPA